MFAHTVAMRFIRLAYLSVVILPLVHCAGDSSVGPDERLPPGGGCDYTDPECIVVPNPGCDEEITIPTSEVVPPDMLLVVDTSFSMSVPMPDGQNKWAVMSSALNSTVSAHGLGIDFGLMTYPGEGSSCTRGSVVADIGASPADISAQLSAETPGGATPTSITLNAALTYYESRPVNPEGRYVMLATDGVPNCVGQPSARTITSIENLALAGIPTYVLGFGEVTHHEYGNPELLSDMAAAGDTGDFLPATSATELQAALDMVAADIVVPPCSYTLGQIPFDRDGLSVSLDGEDIPYDASHVDGWDYDEETNMVTLYGSACTSVESGGADNVEVDYGCGPVY